MMKILIFVCLPIMCWAMEDDGWRKVRKGKSTKEKSVQVSPAPSSNAQSYSTPAQRYGAVRKATTVPVASASGGSRGQVNYTNRGRGRGDAPKQSGKPKKQSKSRRPVPSAPTLMDWIVEGLGDLSLDGPKSEQQAEERGFFNIPLPTDPDQYSAPREELFENFAADLEFLEDILRGHCGCINADCGAFYLTQGNGKCSKCSCGLRHIAPDERALTHAHGRLSFMAERPAFNAGAARRASELLAIHFPNSGL